MEQTETNTRNVQGEIKAWNRSIREREDSYTGETIYQLGFLIGDEWHNINSRDKEAMEKLMTDAPVGSEVKFSEWRKVGSKYWNHKPDSWEVVKKGEGRRSFGGRGGGSYGFRPDRDEWLKEKASIILQSMVARSIELSVKEAKTEDVLKTAEKLLTWHNDKLLPQASFLKQAFEKPGGAKDEEDEIPEENIN